MKKVCGYIERSSMLYKTNVEYGDYTMNHVLGCAHGCKYPCYAFMLKRRFGQVGSYEDWLKPYLVKNTLEILDREIPRLKAKIQSVHLSFTTDPFMYDYYEIHEMSLAAIKKLEKASIKCTVLTKGVLPLALADCGKKNEYGITLVSLDEEYRKKYEPGSALYPERIDSLLQLHLKGCKTWVSIEPYPTPNVIEQDIEKIFEEIKFVNRIIFGRTNYSKEITAYKEHKHFYNEQAQKVIGFCKKHNIDFYIKKGTIT